jgi:PAS domain S-box-containing protein
MSSPTPKWPEPSVSVDELPVAYIEIDARGIIRYANPAAVYLHEIPAEELLGREIWDLLPPDETARSRAAFFANMESGEEPVTVRRSLFNIHGEYRIQEFHRRLLRDADGKAAGISAVIFDVSQLEAASQQPQYRAQWLESILASFPSAVLAADPLGSIGYLNPAAEALTGWSAAELTGQPIETIFPASEARDSGPIRHSFEKAMERSCTYSFQMRTKGGPSFTVEVAAAPVVDKETGYASGLLLMLTPVPKED